MVHGVGNHDVVAGFGGDVVREQHQALGFVEAGRRGIAVGMALVAGTVGRQDGLEVGGELHEAVVPGVGDQPRTGVRAASDAAAGRKEQGLAGEPQGARRRLRRHIRPVAAVQRALRLVFGDQLRDEHGEAVGVAFTGEVGHDVPLGVDDHQRGPCACRVGLPGVQLGIVQDRVADLVTLDGGGQRHRIGLVFELG